MEKGKYRIIIDCCKTGNCIACSKLRVGVKVRRPWSTKYLVTKKLADQIARDWNGYNPVVIEVKEATK